MQVFGKITNYLFIYSIYNYVYFSCCNFNHICFYSIFEKPRQSSVILKFGMLFTGIFFPGKFSFGPKTLKLQISFMGVRKFIKLFVLEKYTTKLLRILNGLSFMRAIKGAAVQFYRQHSQKGYTKPQSYTVYICISLCQVFFNTTENNLSETV